MKQIFFLLFFTIIIGCSKPKTVLICGDHICVNKAEADEYAKQLEDAGAKVELK